MAPEGGRPRTREPTKSSRVFRPALTDFAGAFGARLVQTFLALVTSVYLARALGPSGRGTVAIVVVTSLQTISFFSLGIDTAIVHFSGRQRATIRSLSAASFRAALLLGIPGLFVALVLVRYVFASDLTDNARYSSYILLATIPLSLLVLYLQAILRSAGRILEGSAITAVRSVLLLAGAVTAIEAGWGIPGVVVLYALVELLTAAFTTVASARLGLLQVHDPLSRPVARQLAAYGARGHVGTMLQGLNYRLDVFLLAFFLRPSDVGAYTVVVGVAEFLWMIPNVLGVILLQRSAAAADSEAIRTTAFATRTVCALTAMSCAVWFIGAEPLLRLLFGSRFEVGAAALRILLPGIWALALWKTLANDLAGRGLPQYKSYTAGIGVIATISLDILLIPRLGIEGAALASCAAYGLTSLAMVLLYRRAAHISLRELLIMRRGDLERLRTSLSRALRRGPLRDDAAPAPTEPLH